MTVKLPQTKNRNNEKGAALVTVLMITFLLLVGCIGLLVGAAMNTANVTDAVAEQQAYYAAESGIQSAINVLRRNTAPSPLLDSNKPAGDSSNKIDYYSAIQTATSNKPGDISPDARLSRWMNYNYTSPGSAFPDRVTLGQGTYNPNTGNAFSVTVRDPDNPLQIISLTVTADIGGSGSSKTYTALLNPSTTKIAFSSGSVANVGVSTREIGVSLGTFIISQNTVLGITPPPITDTPFVLTVKMTAPLQATVKLSGTIKGGVVTSASVGNTRITFDTPIPSLIGIIAAPTAPVTPNPPGINGGQTEIGTNLGIKIILAPPRRLVIRATGYGPRGARKVMEAIVQRNNFDGLIPATVTLVGTLTNSLFKSSNSSSQQVSYSGQDPLSTAKIPYIGTVGASGGNSSGLLGGLLTGLLGTLNLTGASCPGCAPVDGNPTDVSDDETPDFLKSAANLDSNIQQLKDTAKSSGRYYTGTDTPPNFGNNADGTGITFIDGDAKLSGSGGGILVVTGKLTLDSAFSFNGTIFVTGEQGVNRTGSGMGNIQGNLVVAPYKIGDLAAGFLPPKYDITGGAVSNILYNASNLLFGSNNYNTVVVGVVEK